jgi:hypothetical protein
MTSRFTSRFPKGASMSSLFRHWFRITSASFRRRPARVSPQRGYLGLDHLEDRLVPATFNVNIDSC